MGGTSITDDWFSLHVTGAPDGKPGLILRGAQTVNGVAGSPVGDGLLCTTGQTARSQVQIISGGVTTFAEFNGNGFGAESYGAGVPTHYQFWYRNPGGISPCGSGSNFSAGATVVWN